MKKFDTDITIRTLVFSVNLEISYYIFVFVKPLIATVNVEFAVDSFVNALIVI